MTPKPSKYLDPQLFSRVANLPLIARTVVEGMISGLHRSPHQGFSVEFAEYRSYAPGDDLKFLDWKALARTDKLYVKTFQAETNLRATLIVDASGSMGFSSTKITKLEYTCFCAAALGYLMIRQQDAVGLAVIGDKIREFIGPRASTAHLRELLMRLDGVEPSGETLLADCLHSLAARLHRRGLLCIFTDLLDDPDAVILALTHFRRRKHEVIVFHVFDDAEWEFPYEDLTEFEDLETGQRLAVQPHVVREEVRRRVREFSNLYRRRCAEQSIEYTLLKTSVPVERALTEYLAKRARLG